MRYGFIDESSALGFTRRDDDVDVYYISDPLPSGDRIFMDAEHDPKTDGRSVVFAVSGDNSYSGYSPTNKFEHQTILATLVSMMGDLVASWDEEWGWARLSKVIKVEPTTPKLGRVYDRLFRRYGWEATTGERDARYYRPAAAYKYGFIDQTSALPFHERESHGWGGRMYVSDEPLPGSGRVILEAEPDEEGREGIWEVKFHVDGELEGGRYEPTNQFEHRQVLATVVSMMEALLDVEPNIGTFEISPSSQALGRIYKRLFRRHGYELVAEDQTTQIYERGESRVAFIDPSSALPFEIESFDEGFYFRYVSAPLESGDYVDLEATRVQHDYGEAESQSGWEPPSEWVVDFSVDDGGPERGKYQPTNKFEHRQILATVVAIMEDFVSREIVDAIEVIPSDPKLGKVYRRLFERHGYRVYEDTGHGQRYVREASRRAFIDESSALWFHVADRDAGSFYKYVSEPLVGERDAVSLEAVKVGELHPMEAGYEDWDYDDPPSVWEVDFSAGGTNRYMPTNKFQHQAVLATVVEMMRDLFRREDVDAFRVTPSTPKLARVYERIFGRAGWVLAGDMEDMPNYYVPA